MYIHIADSLCCTAETNTTLLSNYAPVKINSKVKCRRDSTDSGTLPSSKNYILFSPLDFMSFNGEGILLSLKNSFVKISERPRMLMADAVADFIKSERHCSCRAAW